MELHVWFVVLLIATEETFLGAADISVDVTSLKPVQTIDSRFVGVTIDTQRLVDHFKDNDILSRRFINLAKGLLPSYLRVGGTSQDYLAFSSHKHHVLAHDVWDRLNKMVKAVGWDLIFGLNLKLRDEHGHWDPSDAIDLFKYTVDQGYHVAGWELGNEPEFHHEHPSMASVAADFSLLKKVVDSNDKLKPYILAGGDFTTRKDIDPFLKAGAVHSVDAVTFHHYYMNGKTAKLEDFYSLHKLGTFEGDVDQAVKAGKENGGKPIWLGETSSGYGGGTPNLADRYVAGFMWLDKLGVSASRGLKGVLRQTFVGSNYAMVSDNNDPNPDYWLTVLYKRLVGSPVLSPPKSTNRNVRLYAHCTNRNRYPAGSVTVYMLNVGGDPVTINLGHNHHIDLFMLTPGSHGGLASKTVKLNGKELFLDQNDKLPPLPATKHWGDVKIGGHSFGYVVMPSAKHANCL